MTQPYDQYPPRHPRPSNNPPGQQPPAYGQPGQGPPGQGPPGYGPPGYGPPGSGMVPYEHAGFPAYPSGQQVHPRGRAVGAIVSIFVPGVGSMINGSVGRGFLILVSYLIGVALCLVIIGFLIVPAVWIWAIIDGALSADRWNRAHGIIS